MKKPEITSSTVKSLRADKKKDTNEVVLTWNDPSAKYTSEYIIYRSNQKMLQEIDLQNATIIQRAAQYSVSYTDKESPEGDVYYAVLTQNKQGTIQKNLIADENTLTHPVPAAEITPEKKPEPEAEAETEPESKQGLIYDMQATTERNMVFISWIPDSELYKQLPPKGVYYHIFRFNHEPASIDELAGAHYIAKVAINEESYHDIPDKDGIYYYAIFIATPKGVLPDNLIYGDNLVGPVIYKKGANKVKVGRENGEKEIDSSIFDDTSKLSEEKINNILRRSYLQENYKEALEALQDFRHSPNRKVRARATFYSALSSYYLGNYRQAMDLIMDESVKSVYAERADFWYRQILEKITK
ncbi:MAG: hypothetical protein OEV78_11280 [Spirochaetia bacterium]|nr:hypothetical protein [Spirochaetia bacterium]